MPGKDYEKDLDDLVDKKIEELEEVDVPFYSSEFEEEQRRRDQEKICREHARQKAARGKASTAEAIDAFNKLGAAMVKERSHKADINSLMPTYKPESLALEALKRTREEGVVGMVVGVTKEDPDSEYGTPLLWFECCGISKTDVLWTLMRSLWRMMKDQDNDEEKE